jgi:NAD(P)-dependent dehydrogenase (short-subunit alcohol dehydrogenase family)
MSALVVTGGSRGIGAAICRLGAGRGWAVCVNYANSTEEAAGVVADIEGAGGRAIAVQADVSKPREVEAMFQQVDEVLGPVTGLVNNAGIMGSSGPVQELDAEKTRAMFEVNILGPFLCSQAAIKRMARPKGGTGGGAGGAIVNISSAAAKHGGPGSYVDYAASKAAVDTFTYGLACEQAAAGIRVNCLRPGATMTEMNVRWMEAHPDWLDQVLAKVPLKRAAEVDEIARAALWLLSDEASYVTGAILDASGGWVMP